MILYEFTERMDTEYHEMLTDDFNYATEYADSDIIKWDAELAPKQYQYPITEEQRIKNVELGYNYCNGVGWVKLIKRYEE